MKNTSTQQMLISGCNEKGEKFIVYMPFKGKPPNLDQLLTYVKNTVFEVKEPNYSVSIASAFCV